MPTGNRAGPVVVMKTKVALMLKRNNTPTIQALSNRRRRRPVGNGTGVVRRTSGVEALIANRLSARTLVVFEMLDEGVCAREEKDLMARVAPAHQVGRRTLRPTDFQYLRVMVGLTYVVTLYHYSISNGCTHLASSFRRNDLDSASIAIEANVMSRTGDDRHHHDHRLYSHLMHAARMPTWR